MAAVLPDVRPYAAALGAVSLLGLPAEIVAPVVRRARGHEGVALGPGLVTLANGVVALGVVRAVRVRSVQDRRACARGIPRWVAVAGAGYLGTAPAAATGWQRAIVLPGRSPLWAWLISPIGLLQTAVLLVALRRARRARPD